MTAEHWVKDFGQDPIELVARYYQKVDRTEQDYTVNVKLIQNNLQSICTILKGGIEDNTEAMLINLAQSKTFDRVDYRFLACFSTGFKPDFCKWIFILYHMSTAVVQVSGKHLKSYIISWSVDQSCPLLQNDHKSQNQPQQANWPVIRCLECDIVLPASFNWTDDPVWILGVCFGPGIECERNWSEVQSKVNVSVNS